MMVNFGDAICSGFIWTAVSVGVEFVQYQFLEHKIQQLAESTNLNCILNVKFISRNGTNPQNILSQVTLQFYIHES